VLETETNLVALDPEAGGNQCQPCDRNRIVWVELHAHPDQFQKAARERQTKGLVGPRIPTPRAALTVFAVTFVTKTA